MSMHPTGQPQPLTNPPGSFTGAGFAFIRGNRMRNEIAFSARVDIAAMLKIDQRVF